MIVSWTTVAERVSTRRANARSLTEDERGIVLALCRWFPPRIGGVERYLEQLYEHVDRREVLVQAPREGNWREYDAHPHAFVIERVECGDSNVKWAAILLAVRAIRRVSCGDIGQIHCGHLVLGLAGLVCQRLFGIPYVVFAYGSELGRRRHLWARRLVLQRAACVVTISRSSAMLVRDLGVPAAKIRIIHPSVNSSKFSPGNREGTRAEAGVPASRPMMLTVCRLDVTARHKGVDTALRAVALMRRDVPDVYFLVVGDGDDLPRLQRLVAELDIEENVCFFGKASDDQLAALYGAADVFVLPNRRAEQRGGYSIEGFGIVLLEAAAAGLAVVASRDGGAEDAVEDRVTGILLKESTPEAVATAAKELFSDIGLRMTLGEQARARVVDSFSPESAGMQLTSVIREVDGTR
ncbi:MAG: glycosyltransferase family 4 protein [Solirubrobacteraceae bacterium]